MEEVKSTADYTIYKKRSGRYGVKGTDGKWINGEKKVEILAKEGLIKASPKPKKKTEDGPSEGDEESKEESKQASEEETPAQA